MRTPSLGRSMVELVTQNGSLPVTFDHRVCTSPTDGVPAGQLQAGDCVLSSGGDQAVLVPLLSVQRHPPRTWVYNLSVEEHRKFLVSSSNVIIFNSPDKFYHFMPPQHEGRIGKFDRVFGQIWEDYELLLYLNRGLDDWHLHPPATDFVRTIDEVWSFYPGWRSGVTWAAITHAVWALMLNWIADEFSVSGDTPVSVNLPSGKVVDVDMKELYEICQEDESFGEERRGD